MKRCIVIFGICLSLLTTAAGCGEKDDSPPPTVAASTSYLECAANEFLGEDESVLRLAGPGMCPGHFDIRPSQIEQLRTCRVLLRQDFQESLEAKLSDLKTAGLQVVSIKIPGGLCEPESYLDACRQTADAFVSSGLLKRFQADARLEKVAGRMASLSEWASGQIASADLKGAPVLAGEPPAAGCRSLGLNVVATFKSSDAAGIADIDEAVRSARSDGVKVIIANLPAGRRLADSLADRLGAKVIVFGNFPTAEGFDKLVRDNVSALVAAKQ
ncbi:MAG: zinc ABC transporter substrate-binding protein [Planctomycetota bacterium]|nr:zinc ABC transporter substrate-binding protein [Planctomycetota bacterium]